MKLGIAGCGKIVKTVLSGEGMECLPFEKRYLYGRRREAVEELCERYRLDGFVTDYEELLQLDVDTIYIALPNTCHYAFAKKALEQGKHVIIEKPVTVNQKELEDLAELARSKGKILLEAMNIHSLPIYQMLSEAVGRIGRIRIVSFNYSQYSSRYDAFREGRILPAFDRHQAGGALMDLNVYNIHALIGLFGEPTEVHYAANIEREIDTSGILTMGYPTFQAVAIGAKDCASPVMLTIQGDQGMIRIDQPINRFRSFEIIMNQGEREMVSADQGLHRLYYEFADFLRIIDGNETDEAERRLELSLASMKVLDEARQTVGIRFPGE